MGFPLRKKARKLCLVTPLYEDATFSLPRLQTAVVCSHVFWDDLFDGGKGSFVNGLMCIL